MKDVASSSGSAFFPRLFAALSVIVLISMCAFTGILGIAFVGAAFNHGTRVNHAAGQIVEVGPGKDFVLLTANGQHLIFQCGMECRASLDHMQRHLREHAHTDVYYIEGNGKTFMALDVD